MIRKLFMAVIISASVCNVLTAQKDSVDSFWVMVEDFAAKESDDCTSFTNNDEINELFKRYNVIEYKQALPFVKTPRLHDG